MAHAITGIDHGIIGVDDLEAARATWQRLGFTLTPQGRHIGWTTANYCLMFDDDYLELMGRADVSQPNPALEAALAKGEGLYSLALASDDPVGAHASLTADGLNPEEISDLARELDMPGQAAPASPRFRIVKLPQSTTPDMSMFICHHLDPSMVWRPEWQIHANGARGINSFTIVVDHPERLLEPYEKLFGIGSCIPTDDTLAVFTGHANLIFVTLDDAKTIYPDVPLDEETPLPHIIGVSLTVPTPDIAADYLTTAGVPYAHSDNGTVRVAPEHANGVTLEFAIAP